MRPTVPAAAVLTIAALAQSSFAPARAGDDPAPAAGDSLRLYELGEEVIVSAAKLPIHTHNLAASASILTTETLRETSARTLPEALAAAAGLHTYDFAGNGMVATAETRGFAAFGESAHLRFLVDGIPFSDLANDNAIWNLLDLDQLSRVEVIRSAASMLHGNASFAGAVNLVPRAPRAPWSSWGRVGGGSHDRQEFTGGAGWRNAGTSGIGSVHWRHVGGWRDHSDWRGTSSFGTAGLNVTPGLRARVGVYVHEFDAEQPGALTRGVAGSAPETSSTPFDDDDATNLYLTGVLEPASSDRNPYKVTTFVHTESRTVVRTIAFSTQEENRDTFVWGGQASWQRALSARRPLRLQLGIEGSLGRLDNAYRAVDAGGTVGDLLSAGDVERDEVAAYARLEADVTPAVQVALGIRRDELRGGVRPAGGGPPVVEPADKTMGAWSPSASVNVSWARGSNAYLLVNRSFKTPTLTQLYDVRTFDIDGPGPIPPFTISNEVLEPQLATQFEVGARGQVGDRLAYDVAFYTMKVEDEIGFNLARFTYENLQESTHRGLELSLAGRPLPGLSVDAGYTYTRARFDQSGSDSPNVGNQINNVPKHIARLGVAYERRGLALGSTAAAVYDQFADEANTVRVEDYIVVDLRGAYRFAGQELYVKVINLLDETYAPAGFIGVGRTGEPVPLFYPAPGRWAEAGVRFAIR